MLKLPQYYIFLIILLGSLGQAFGQKHERIKYKADELEYGKKNGDSYRKLTGNVIFTQESTTVYCDTSYYYRKDNMMNANGHVHIIDDSTDITSKKLIYEGNDRMAKLRDKVVYVRGDRRLYTDFLDYDLDNEIAHYFNSGKLYDSTNVLTSKIGFYYAQDDYALFYKNVTLTTEDFVLKTDTLRYNTKTKVAYTFGPSTITTDDGTVVKNKAAEFRTISDQSEFKNGQIETEDYYLEGDKLYFDDIEKYYKAISNVKMTAKDEDVIITGDEGFYDRKNGLSKVYGHALMKRVLEADTFYLAADTLVSIENDFDSLKRILAYHDVKAYKKGLQGIADSMAYFVSDSLIFFYNDPVMWNNKNQITADTIYLEVSKDEIKQMNLLTNSFLASEDSIQNYNQIKGREMKAYFKDNELDKIDVNGNGEILYYALEEGDSVLMGMNKIFCATMQIRFEDMKLTSFSVYTNPEASFIPPHELTAEIMVLDNFSWRIDERPALFDVAPYLNPDYVKEEIEIDDIKMETPPTASKKSQESVTNDGKIQPTEKENPAKDVNEKPKTIVPQQPTMGRPIQKPTGDFDKKPSRGLKRDDG